MTSSHMTTTSLPSGFIMARARPIVSRTPEFPIPDFPKRVISRHVTSLSQTIPNCSRVSTLESLDPLSPGLPTPRSPISCNGRSYDTWPLSIRRLRSILGIPQWKVSVSCQQESRFHDPRFPILGDLTTCGLCQSDGLDLFRGFSPLYTGVLTLR
jgi:hypothetical protein